MTKPAEIVVKKFGSPKTAGSAPEIQPDIQQDIADTISSWITEHRENLRTERLFSDEKISAWKSIPLPSKA